MFEVIEKQLFDSQGKVVPTASMKDYLNPYSGKVETVYGPGAEIITPYGELINIQNRAMALTQGEQEKRRKQILDWSNKYTKSLKIDGEDRNTFAQLVEVAVVRRQLRGLEDAYRNMDMPDSAKMDRAKYLESLMGLEQKYSKELEAVHVYHDDKATYRKYGNEVVDDIMKHLADTLESIIALHGAETIAAVIVEPMAGSTGVLVPPVGYLEKLREITKKHGIVLIFDEVITGYGRVGGATAAGTLGVTPDMITMAKGLTNAAVPMGAVAVSRHIHDGVVDGSPDGIELFHGYTYSGHPLAAAAGIATLDLYQSEGIFEHAQSLHGYWQEAVHSLKGRRHIIDIRNMGIVAGIELEPRPGAPTKRAMELFHKCFDAGLLVRATGDIIALSPPLILEKPHIDEMVGRIADIIETID
jgi:hypothetical protein